MSTLEQQIAELTAKHNLQIEVETKLPNIKKIYTNPFNYKGKGTTVTITAYLDEIPLTEISERIQEVIAAFPPTRNNCLTFAGKDDHPTANPYMLRWENGIREKKVKIDYVSGETWVHIQVPISYYSDDCKGQFTRRVTDSELHYFPGESRKEIDRKEILSYKLDMFESCKYYGGSVVNFIESEDDKEEFESVVLKGHTPEFADFWQNQLASI